MAVAEPRTAVPAGAPVHEAQAPGVAWLFGDIDEEPRHSVLDLGAGSPSSLAVYSRFARRIRFADLGGQLHGPNGWRTVDAVLTSLPEQPDHPYDLVFVWDALDRLLREYRAPLVARLAAITSPSAKLHAITRSVDSGGGGGGLPHGFALLDTGRMTYDVSAQTVPATPRIMPAQMAQLLVPFRVVHGFTLKGELREYVAHRHP
jgi:hypothetical protein